MATLLRVPEVAAGATEVVVSEWLVDEGADVTTGAAVVALETEKAVVEVRPRRAACCCASSSTPGRRSRSARRWCSSAAVETGADVDALLRRARRAGQGGRASCAGARAPRRSRTASRTPRPATRTDGKRIFATPLSRRLLAEAGIGLDEVTGTGPNGRITKKDAEQATARKAQPVAQAPAPSPRPRPPARDPAAHCRRRPAGVHRDRALAAAPRGRGPPDRQQADRPALLREALGPDRPAAALRAQLNDVSPHRISVNDLVIRAVACRARRGARGQRHLDRRRDAAVRLGRHRGGHRVRARSGDPGRARRRDDHARVESPSGSGISSRRPMRASLRSATSRAAASP